MASTCFKQLEEDKLGETLIYFYFKSLIKEYKAGKT